MTKHITAKERLSYIEGFLFGLKSAFSTDEKNAELTDALECIIEDLHSAESELESEEMKLNGI